MVATTVSIDCGLITMRVLSIDDLDFNDKSGSLYMTYQQQKETLARLNQAGTFGALGIRGIP